MNRRSFLGVTGLAGAGVLAQGDSAHAEAAETGRDYYELRQYTFESEDQVQGFDDFFRDAAIPALNRHGVDTVGVFKAEKEFSPIYVVMKHPSMDSIGSMTPTLFSDEQFLKDGAKFLDATSYMRMESTLLAAFPAMPHLEKPVKGAGRVVQLRTYESPTVKAGMKKIEMFETKEIGIFRKTGLNPVFFGACIAGAKMPNLTYMLAFESEDEMKAAWQKFIADPEWKELSAIPDYADKKILCGITNVVLWPTAYSQI